MLTTLMLLMACSGDSETPSSAPPPPPPAAEAPSEAPPAPPADGAASANAHQLDGYRGAFAKDPLLAPGDVALAPRGDFRAFRNEIFARYGRAFKSEDLQKHFGKEPWYKTQEDFSESWLTANDQANVTLIQRFEGDTQASILERGEYNGSMQSLTFVDAATAEVGDGSQDMYNWERQSRHWVAAGDFVITWEGKSAKWNPRAPGVSSVQLWELDHDSGSIESVTELKSLRG